MLDLEEGGIIPISPLFQTTNVNTNNLYNEELYNRIWIIKR